MKGILSNKSSGPKKTSLPSSIAIILLGVVVAGCPVLKTEKIVIRGSNTIGEELAPRLIAEFQKARPAVSFDAEFKGTTYGFGALMARRSDIAAASREISKNELELAGIHKVEFNNYVIGSYSVAVIVNAGSQIGNLSLPQVRDIFTGAIQNWKEVGGPDAPINLYIRDLISGTFLGFRELAMEDKPYALHPRLFTNYTEIVQGVAQDVNGIGYASFDQAAKPGVKALSIGGVAPTFPAVNQGQYPYARTLRFYTDKEKESAATHDFIQFVQSPPGQRILEQMGFVPRL
jgi:phosphate transport system substrate-binding protein